MGEQKPRGNTRHGGTHITVTPDNYRFDQDGRPHHTAYYVTRCQDDDDVRKCQTEQSNTRVRLLVEGVVSKMEFKIASHD